MKNCPLMKPAVLVVLALVLSHVNCTRIVSGGGTETGNPTVSAMLYNPGGSPAAHAKVRFYPVNYNPRTGGLSKKLAAADSTSTDANGNYTAKLDTGAYNVLASGDSGVVYQDSITVVKDSTIHPPADTLKAPGGIRGRVRLQPGDDARTVFILFLGTNTWGTPDDSIGRFTVANMAEGTYRVRILTTLDAYVPKDTVLSVSAGRTDSLPHDIVLQYTGIPVVGGFQISYDSLKEIVTLIWKRADTALVKSYNVYRRNIDSNTILGRINSVPIIDTTFADSGTIQGQAYEYEVAAVNKSDAEGNKTTGISLTATSAFELTTTIGNGEGIGPGKFSGLMGIAVDRYGNIYAVDNGHQLIHKFDANGIETLEWGGTFGNSAGQFRYPTGICVDTFGYVYVADAENDRVQKFDSNGSFILAWGSTGSGDGQFQNTYAISANSAFVYVGEGQGTRVQKFDLQGTYISTISVNAKPNAVFANDSCVLVISEGKNILRFTVDGTFVDTVYQARSRPGISYPDSVIIGDLCAFGPSVYTVKPYEETVVGLDYSGKEIFEWQITSGVSENWPQRIDVVSDQSIFVSTVAGYVLKYRLK